MAYNLQPLITILKQILNPRQTHRFVTKHKNQLESLLQKSLNLKELLENSTGPKLESLGSQIRDASHKAEDIIECHMLNQVDLWRTRTGTGLSLPALDLQQVIKEFDSAIEQAVAIVEEKTMVLTGMSSSAAAAFLPDHLSSKCAVVGFDEALLQLKDRLTGNDSKLGIVPIVGMGGIGKTTLAQLLYEDKLIAYRFDVRAWATISQDHNLREVVLGLLRLPNEKLDDELTECTDNDKLTHILYQRLFGRRYLVVLDDMWSTHSWDAIRKFFPDNNNGSRIILTTRDLDVARYVGEQSLLHEVELMNESQSWNLLHRIVFGEEKCPGALQEIGRNIARDCGGLPLAINVIGGILPKAERSVDVWQHIANDVKAAIAETSNNEFSNVLDLSYKHLPNQLKPCFLYMGAFPEDCQIKGSRLISLLVAEGFAESDEDKSWEEVAEDYIEGLVQRNLVMVTRKRSNGKALCYGMHDLLRDLCRRKCGVEKFVHVKNERFEVGKALMHCFLRFLSMMKSGEEKIVDVKNNERSVEVEMALKEVRRVSVQQASYSYGSGPSGAMSLARSLIICLGVGRDIRAAVIISPPFPVLRLLRVLDALDVQIPVFPKEVLQLVNLRYLAFSCGFKSDIPREISRLLNLQTLIAKIKGGNVPDEIREMSELIDLKLDTFIYIGKGACMKPNMNEKLQRISGPTVKWTVFFESIPNVRKLAVSIGEWNEVVDLSHLQKLHTFRCESDHNGVIWRCLPILRFPPSLRKLSLFKCLINGRDWTILCALHNLEVLKICYCELENEAIELEKYKYVFKSLQSIQFWGLKNLVRWTADDTNFPTLRELAICDCPVLEEIPSGIGDISTLQMIGVYYRCSPSLEASAKKIKEVQQSEYGNYDINVVIYH